MVDTVTPSSITPGQIGKLQEILGAGLRKSGLSSESVQQVLETQGDGLVEEVVAVIRRRAEVVNNMIVRRVNVNRDVPPRQTLEATGRRLYVTDSVVETMPRGDGEEVEVVFFKVGRFISDQDLEKKYKLRGLRPVDPVSLATVNENDPSFADDHPNCTHWKDAEGKWCYAAFSRWAGERYVYVHRYDDGWGDRWWFAGLRK